MRENITKVAERGERLDSLQDKTGELASICIGAYVAGSLRRLCISCHRDGLLSVEILTFLIDHR
jgi:Synaptobrevin